MARALVIGGGIGGLAAAVALRRVGIEAEVFERAPEIREVGAGLSLWSNAVLALRRLGLDEAVLALGSQVGRVRTLSDDGRPLDEIDLEPLARQAGAPSVCAHRADLQGVLAGALPPDTVHTGAECIGVELQGDRVTAHFAGGRIEEGDLLIGADGIHSAVRASLFGHSKPRYAGYTCWRGVANLEHPGLPPELSLLLLGAGTQVGLWRCGSGRVYWFIASHAPQGQADPPEGASAALLRAFESWHPVLAAALSATEGSAVFRNDIIDRPPTRGWGEGRVTLLGDAAHPTTPNLGQGACQALEDAVVLADSLATSAETAVALRRYERLRQPRTALVTRQSWLAGRVLQWQSTLGVRLRERMVRAPIVRRRGEVLLEELLCYPLPELEDPPRR